MARTVHVIRDEITINAGLRYLAELQPGDTLRLIARQITQLETCDLKGVNLELFTDSFSALNGAVIFSQGTPGVQGTPGNNGAWGNQEARHGSVGERGNAGANGTSVANINPEMKVNVKIIAEVMAGLRVNVKGGKGGKGGTGGYGGKGYRTIERKDGSSPIFIDLSNGGSGGDGGPGGNGGQGGNVTIWSSSSAADGSIDVSGGAFGEKGDGGGYGGAGDLEWIEPRFPLFEDPILEFSGGDPGNNGNFGTPGEDGPSGELKTLPYSYDLFWSSITSESFASEWAKYRHAVGEFFFRSYIPGLADRDQYIGRAIDEFNAALRLNPNQKESIVRREQIWADMNPLGLHRKLDVIPNFKEYINNLTNLGTLVATFKNMGTTLLLNSAEVERFKNIFESEMAQSNIRINEAVADLKIYEQDKVDIKKAQDSLENMMNDVRQRIDQAKEDMKKKPMSFRDIVGTIGDLAITVSAVMAAVPTAGTSLLVLAPDILSFSKTIYDNGSELVKAIIDDQETETLRDATDKFNKVKADVSTINDASTKITNLLNVIKAIKGGNNPDNSQLMDLVQKGVELAYEHLLKQQELNRVEKKVEVVGVKLASEEELLKFHKEAINRTTLDERIIREAGLKVNQAAFSKVDILLDFAFRAQRSIEIYLLKDQSRYVYYDVGRLHPDIEADFVLWHNVVDLAASYDVSFSKLLNPTDMWGEYNDYFGRVPLYADIHRLSIVDPTLESFRSKFTLTFSIDPAKLSAQRFNTKIQAIAIAFVGATGQGGLVSCKIEHSGLYSQRVEHGELDSQQRSIGTIEQTILKARHDFVTATVVPLQVNGFDLDASPPLDEPQNSPLWAMGIGGLYTITIPQSEIDEHNPSFEGLKEIQVWIGYQFVE